MLKKNNIFILYYYAIGSPAKLSTVSSPSKSWNLNKIVDIRNVIDQFVSKPVGKSGLKNLKDSMKQIVTKGENDNENESPLGILQCKGLSS